jgi:hypothetical protein
MLDEKKKANGQCFRKMVARRIHEPETEEESRD